MCFPSKRTKDNHKDDTQLEAAPHKQDSAPANGSHPQTVPPIATTEPIDVHEPEPEPVMSPPRVAIIIYSMYGHIAKRESSRPSSSDYTAHVDQWPSPSRQVSRQRVARPPSSSTWSFRLTVVSTIADHMRPQDPRDPPRRGPLKDARPSKASLPSLHRCQQAHRV